MQEILYSLIIVMVIHLIHPCRHGVIHILYAMAIIAYQGGLYISASHDNNMQLLMIKFTRPQFQASSRCVQQLSPPRALCSGLYKRNFMQQLWASGVIISIIKYSQNGLSINFYLRSIFYIYVYFCFCDFCHPNR